MAVERTSWIHQPSHVEYRYPHLLFTTDSVMLSEWMNACNTFCFSQKWTWERQHLWPHLAIMAELVRDIIHGYRDIMDNKSGECDLTIMSCNCKKTLSNSINTFDWSLIKKRELIRRACWLLMKSNVDWNCYNRAWTVNLVIYSREWGQATKSFLPSPLITTYLSEVTLNACFLFEIWDSYMAVILRISAFWDVTPYSLVPVHQTSRHPVTKGCNFICSCPQIFR